MNKIVLGYVLLNKNNRCLMMDNFLNLYFGNLEIDSDYFSSDVVLFKSKEDKDYWVKNSNKDRKFQNGSRVNVNQLSSLELFEIAATKRNTNESK